jgi:pimeloyl-ACP methyl ester carboxylesterase
MVVLAGCQSVPGDTTTTQTRSGGSFAIHTFAAKNAQATILMFEGAGGVFNPGGAGFINAHYGDFVDRGFTVVLMEPPADKNDFHLGGGMHPLFRESANHVQDIDAVISMLRKNSTKPIWLLGISMGTKSVANYAANRSNRISGAIFLSSSTRPPGISRSVADYEFGSLRAPVLAIAHRDDACRGTPPSGAREIVRAARSSRDAKSILLSGGSAIGRRPCGPRTPHTFNGIESQVITAVSEFIGKHLN